MCYAQRNFKVVFFQLLNVFFARREREEIFGFLFELLDYSSAGMFFVWHWCIAKVVVFTANAKLCSSCWC